MNEAYSLFELNTFIRRIIALNLPDLVWVKCEIAQVNKSRGHYYLDLVEKGEGNQDVLARCSAVIWAKNYKKLLRNRGTELGFLLQEGMEVQVSCKVDYHEQYGLKLSIEDIDPTYTLGKMELRRRETIRSLRDLDLIDQNGQLPLPIVLQRIAVLSAESAAGYRDYLQHLNNNEYGYAYDNQLFKTAMQGVSVEAELISQLKRIEKRASSFDCVVIIRGGGAKFDLSAFDSFELCKAIAEFPLPILTGIGHDIDETVADLVSYQSLKTPTAVADFIIQRNLFFESNIVQLGMYLNSQVGQIIHDQNILIERIHQSLNHEVQRKLENGLQMIDFIERELPKLATQTIESHKRTIQNYETILEILSPETALKRGFTITSKDGKSLFSSSEIAEGEVLTTIFWDGKIKSKKI